METAQAQLPQYQCHKKVWALKIERIEYPHGKGQGFPAKITPVEQRFAPFEVPQAFIDKHDPKPGGYYVVYDDGYKSFSPAKAFEEGYTRI